jgi:hypothetical protein
VSQSGQKSGPAGRRRGASGSGAGAKASARKSEGSERPGASGHRFGPELACSECGILWDAHQREPAPCKIELVTDVFARRPSGDFEKSAEPAPTEGAAETTKKD